ncbi:hypothetical protein SAMN05444000_12046 [Shimia gijangensis]|uniref:Hemolysin-type calcium-binding repeat-containing protein n=1 Tax=Shimia gijangensis TaxID=1470563 RepID=A0A1M6Q651_9RHOB|nr:hypothetical protein [Shimia gijangensis]SHK15603.1 hypothetical protein SAMN05444000_12046 [Shimia gijangensis]
MGATVENDNLIEGTTDNDTLDGTDGNDINDPLTNDWEDIINGSSGNDLLVFSEVDSSSFYTIIYEDMDAGITVNLDAEYGIAEVDKGLNGTDTLVDFHDAIGWNTGGQGGWIGGTSHDDV